MRHKDPRSLAKAKLAESGLTLEDARRLGIEVQDARGTRQSLPGNQDVPDLPSLKIRYHDAKGRPIPGVHRVRLLGEAEVVSFSDVSRPRRYLQPTGVPPAAYLPRLVDWSKVFEDPKIPIVVTEGELKAACASKMGVPTIGLGGVDSWSQKKRGVSFLPELERAEWAGREVFVVYDSDAAKKPQVASAQRRLAEALMDRGAVAKIACLPDVPGLKKTGLDDFLVARGRAALDAVLEAAEADELTRKLWQFNERFAFVVHPGFVVDEGAFDPSGLPDDHRPPRTQARMDPGNFKNALFANEWARKVVSIDHEDGAVKAKDVQVAKEWVEWPRRRQYQHVTYAPGQARAVGDYYNTWVGWGAEEKEGDVGPWDDLMRHLFRGQDEVREWFESWCAWPFANPGAKLNTAVLLWSVCQGIGKSVVGKTLGACYGSENWSEISQKELDGDFNGWAVCKQFVMVDDMTSTDSRAKADVLKKYVTQQWLQANEKHVATYALRDTVNFLLTSNRGGALQVDEADRRFLIHEVEASPCGSVHPTVEESKACRKCGAFWDRYYSWLKGGGPSHLLHRLRRRKFGSFRPDGWAPSTEAKRDMIAATKSEAAQWAARLRLDPESVLWGASGPLKRDVYTPSELLAMFDRERKGNPVTANAMGLVLKEHGFPRAADASLRTQDGMAKHVVVRNFAKWGKATRAEIERHVRAGIADERGLGEDGERRGKKY